MVKIKEKDIMTLDQAPWIEYLVIDSKTGARKLKKDTPKEIKDAYDKYLKKYSKKKNVSK